MPRHRLARWRRHRGRCRGPRLRAGGGVYIGSVKPNIGHSESASGITSLIKAVLALEHRTIPPNIKLATPSPSIPFVSARLVVPAEPTPWPESRAERASINSFGIGGTNVHAVLESARSFHAEQTPSPPSYAPQLLLYSAHTADAAKAAVENYSKYVDENPDLLEDLAYTLANRREHLAYRAFSVASEGGIGAVSQISKPGLAPDVVMVFTDQGAQWPQMGRELLQWAEHPVFKQTIRALDKHLQAIPYPPHWSIERELARPSKSSRLNSAAISQPLCTAVQIALVDSLAALGIRPAAVVGKSSGEIAAAYAVGALTAREAIAIAFFRGRVSPKQAKASAMGEIGDEYHALVESVLLEAKAPSKPFFSSVAGKMLSSAADLGARYWQKHLESPVLFNAAVSHILQQHSAAGDAVLLEIGPHSALQTPLRQIQEHASTALPYVPAMLQNQNCVESFLAAMGKLHVLGVPVDFAKLVPGGSTLPDLPPLSVEPLGDLLARVPPQPGVGHRQFAHHDLLGVRLAESTDFDPAWRNMLDLDHVPWLRDHRLRDDIVFPFAGYVAMAGEAVRQLSGIEDGFKLQDVLASTALVLSEGRPTELVTNLRRHRLTDSLDSDWWEFTVALAQQPGLDQALHWAGGRRQ